MTPVRTLCSYITPRDRAIPNPQLHDEPIPTCAWSAGYNASPQAHAHNAANHAHMHIVHLYPAKIHMMLLLQPYAH